MGKRRSKIKNLLKTNFLFALLVVGLLMVSGYAKDSASREKIPQASETQLNNLAL